MGFFLHSFEKKIPERVICSLKHTACSLQAAALKRAAVDPINKGNEKPKMSSPAGTSEMNGEEWKEKGGNKCSKGMLFWTKWPECN